MNAGWLIVNKPLGWTSADVVRCLKRRVKRKAKIGHAGTLDPMATGVLPLAWGQATKAIPFLHQTHKTYRFCIVFGIATSTDDQEGQIIATTRHKPCEQDIQRILPQFVGLIEQVPPRYCAAKIAGKRAYTLARQGETVTLGARPVVVDAFRFLSWVIPYHEALFEVTCGTGTYVRALARDLAQSLGTCGYVSQLHRVAVGPFHADQAISVEQEWDGLLPLEAAFEANYRLFLTPQQAHRIQRGQSIALDKACVTGTRLAMLENKPLAFISVEGHYGQPLRVLT